MILCRGLQLLGILSFKGINLLIGKIRVGWAYEIQLALYFGVHFDKHGHGM
jgi:hypothetical protein